MNIIKIALMRLRRKKVRNDSLLDHEGIRKRVNAWIR